MSLDDAEMKVIQAANEELQRKANEAVADIYRRAAEVPVIKCGQCGEPTASLTARAKVITQENLFGPDLFPDITQLKMVLVCPRCLRLP